MAEGYWNNDTAGLRFLPVTITDTIPAGENIGAGVLISTLTNGIITNSSQIKGFCPFNNYASDVLFLQYQEKIYATFRESSSSDRQISIRAVIIY